MQLQRYSIFYTTRYFRVRGEYSFNPLNFHLIYFLKTTLQEIEPDKRVRPMNAIDSDGFKTLSTHDNINEIQNMTIHV